MKLSDWIEREGLTLAAAAKALGLPNATVVRRYAIGQHIPKRPAMTKIFERTGGLVAPADFYRLETADNSTATGD